MARQSAAERAWSAISRFYDNCKKQIPGKKGYPKFKKYCRSVEYKTSGWKLSENKKAITFSDKKGICKLKLKGTYDLNYYQINQIKRVRLVRRADGYYCQFAIKADVQIETESTGKAIGLDVGIKYFLADSNGNTVENPQFYREHPNFEENQELNAFREQGTGNREQKFREQGTGKRSFRF
jgi:putative transposase